jgi:hypothetical protein
MNGAEWPNQYAKEIADMHFTQQYAFHATV